MRKTSIYLLLLLLEIIVLGLDYLRYGTYIIKMTDTIPSFFFFSVLIVPLVYAWYLLREKKGSSLKKGDFLSKFFLKRVLLYYTINFWIFLPIVAHIGYMRSYTFVQANGGIEGDEGLVGFGTYLFVLFEIAGWFLLSLVLSIGILTRKK